MTTLTLSEVATFTGRSLRTVRRWIAEGRLQKQPRASHEPINAPTRVAEDELQRFLAQQRLVALESMPEDAVIQRTYAYLDERIEEQLLPLIQSLQAEVHHLRIKVAQLEEDRQREERLKVKPVSPWRKLLGVD